MPIDGKSLAGIVRAGLENACEEFSTRVEPLGFRRTLKRFWTRCRPTTVDFIHFHRNGSTRGATMNASVDIRVHFGIRVLNDDFPAAVLNGPHSDPDTLRSGRYHLRFNAGTNSSFERCVDDLVRFAIEQGEPWFDRFGTPESLLQSPDSPLRPQEREFLRAACDGRVDAERIAASLKLLGIKVSAEQGAS